MAFLYADENFPYPVVAELRRLGHDVVTVQEEGLGSASTADPAVLHHATAQGRAVLTINRRDFIRLHHQNTNHAGIVACTADADFSRQGERIHQALQGFNNLTGILLRVNRTNP